MVVGREEADATNVRRDVVQNCLSDRDAVVGAGSTAKLIEDNKRAWAGLVQDLFGLGELDEESRLCGKDVVVCAETRHDAVNGGQTAGTARNVTTDLRHDHRNTRL